MAEVLDYAPDLRAITGGRGDYIDAVFERHEEIPGHLAQKVIDAANQEEGTGSKPDASRCYRAGA